MTADKQGMRLTYVIAIAAFGAAVAPCFAGATGSKTFAASDRRKGMAREPSAYTEYIDAKKSFQQADRDYLDYLEQKRRLAAERDAGLEQYRYKKAYHEWAAERARREFVRTRDSKERQPASALQARELAYEKEHARYLAERERDRLWHIYRRDIRQKAREDVEANPFDEAVRKRNEKPWDE